MFLYVGSAANSYITVTFWSRRSPHVFKHGHLKPSVGQFLTRLTYCPKELKSLKEAEGRAISDVKRVNV